MLTADQIREAVAQAEVTVDNENMLCFHISTGTVRIPLDGFDDAAKQIRDRAQGNIELQWCADALLARARPIFAALDVLKSVQRGGEWEYSSFLGQFFTGHPPARIVERKSQGWAAFVWDQEPGRNGWHGKWVMPDPPRPDLVEAAYLLYSAFGDKLARMYAQPATGQQTR